jgi:TonB-linked SusC/RagA family outer membrane protein
MLFLVAVLTVTSASAQSQSTVTIDLANATLATFFKSVEAQTDYHFLYQSDAVDGKENVTVHLKNVSLKDALTKVLSKNNLNYEITPEKTIVISKKGEDTTTKKEKNTKNAVKRTIKGAVYDSSDYPATGATIQVEGTTIATSADIDGQYTLANVPENATVVVSFIGYHPQKFKATDTKALAEVHLVENAELLNEVVVVGYGTQKKANLTGAVASVSQEQIKDRPVDNLGRTLQGLIPNLNVTVSSGQPGSGATLNVRGTTSPNGGSPLILIDGVENDIDRINSHDVESVTVLKDAASAAIYGARGAFGVILITTKSGKFEQKPEVSYSGSFSVSAPTTSTDYETRGYYSAKIADFFLTTQSNTPYTSYTEADYQALWERRNDKTENPERPWVVTETRNGKKQYLYYANFDWYNYLYDDSRPSWDHNVNIRGGSKNVSYLISGRYNQQQGINRIQPDKYKSYNMRVKLDVKITPNFTLSNNTKFFSSTYNYYGCESEYNNFRKPTMHALASMVPINPDGTAVSHTTVTNSSAHYLMDGYNALLQGGKSLGHNKTKEFSTMFEATYKFSKQFNVKADFSYTTYNYRNDYRGVYVEYSQYPGEVLTEPEKYFPNQYSESLKDRNYYVTDAYATYQNTWNDAHNLTVIGGFNYEAKYYRNVAMSNDGLLSDDLSDFNLAAGTTNMSLTGGQNEYAIMGLFYRAAYNFKGKYLAEVNGRYDGTSRFPRGKRFGFFPSYSAGYRISEEPYFKPLRSFVDNFKIRLSYGSLGNQQIGYYDFIQTISTGGNMSGYTFDGVSLGKHATVSDPASSDQTWEKVITKNLGFDLGVLNNRLSFTSELYIRDVKGILAEGKALPSIYGASEPQVNANDLRTKGYELTLTWNDQFQLLGKPFVYSVSASLSDYSSKYTKCDNPTGLISSPYVGKNPNEIWGYCVDGLFKSDEEAAAYAEQVNLQHVMPGCFNATGAYGIGVRGGDLKFLDLNGDGIVNGGSGALGDTGDRVIIGDSTPKHSYSFSGSAQWYGFDVAVFFQGIGHMDWYPGADNMRFWGPYCRPYATFIPRNFMSNVWSETNTDAYYPRPRAYASLSTTNGTVYYTNTRYLQNLAYCRLKNLTVGYTLPQKWAKKVYMQKCRIYVTGENLWTWTALMSDFLDPEQASAATDKKSNVYPWYKTYSVGLNVTF